MKPQKKIKIGNPLPRRPASPPPHTHTNRKTKTEISEGQKTIIPGKLRLPSSTRAGKTTSLKRLPVINPSGGFVYKKQKEKTSHDPPKDGLK